MNLIIFAALIAAGGTAKLDRSYLPPASAATAGGSAGNLQLPFSRSNQVSQEVPAGGFVNDHQGVVVDAAPVVAGVRASNQQSGLGGPRISYGSTDSKVGDAAFRVTSQNQEFLNEFGEPDLSAFHKPPSSSPSSSGHSQIIKDPSHTLNYQNGIDIDKFNYAFETNNGIKVAQNGIDMNGVQSQGAFSYFGDDGKQYSVSYTADKNGFRPQGSHLPTPPPIPPEILLALERNAKDEAAGIIDDGSYDARKYNAEGDYTKNEANDKYNDRQSNKFGNRPVFDGGIINQKQQASVIPNFNGQFVYNTASKDSTFSKPDSSGLGSSLMQSDSRFGSSKEPSKMNVHFYNNMKEKDNQSPVSLINIMESNNSPKPLSQHNLQVQSFQKPSFVKPSSYDVSNDGLPISPQSSSLASSSPLNQESINSFGNGNRVSSSFGHTYENKPSQGPFDSDSSSNQQIFSNQPSTEYFGSQATQQFPSHQNDRFSESIGSSPFSSSSQNVEHSQNSNGFSSSFPTKQPQITLTIPLESFGTANTTEISTQTENFKIKDSDTTKIPEISSTNKEIQAFPGQSTTIGDMSASYTGTYSSSLDSIIDKLFPQNFGSQPTQVLENNREMAQASQLLNQPIGADSVSNTQRPSYEGSQFIQPQAPDHSYLYNPPSKPFNVPSTMPGFNFPRVPSSQFNKVTPSLKPQTSIFTNTPQTAIFSTLNQGIGVTQAAISPFPSTIPLASSNLKQPTQSNSRPSQIASLNTPSVSAFSQVKPTSASAAAPISTLPDDQKLSDFQEVQESQPQDEKLNTLTQQYIGEIYQYSKPTEASPTENQKQNKLTQNQREQSGFSTIQLFNLQSLTTPFENQDTTSNDLPTSQLGGQFNSPSSHQGSKLHSEKPQISMQVGSQFNNAVFNNKGSSIPASNQDAAPQFSFKPISSSPGKFPNQQSQLGQQNFPSYFIKPESQLIQFESHPKPQFEQGNFGEKQPFSQNSGQQFGIPGVSQTASNGFNSQNLVSQIDQQSFSSLTKGPFIQANTEAQFNKFNTQTPQFNTKENTQFNQGIVNNKEGAIYQHIGTQSNFKPSTYLPPSFQSQSAGFNSEKPIAEFDQSSFSISSLPSTQFGNEQASTIFESGIFNNKETTTSQFQQPNQQFETRFGNNPSTPISSSSQTQFSRLNTQSTTPQFGQPTTSNSGDLLTNTQFGQYSNSKTTTSQFEIGQQSTTSFNEPSTIPPSTSEIQTTIQSSDFGEIYDYKKPAQQSSTQFGQQDFSSTQKLRPSEFVRPASTVQFGESTISTSGQLSTNIPLQSTQINTQFGQDSNSKITASQFEIDQQSTTSFNEPSTIPPNTLETQTPTQSSESGEIYDYKEPAQGFISPSQKEENSQIKLNSQFGAQSSTQFGQQALFSAQKVRPSQSMPSSSSFSGSQFSIFGFNEKETITTNVDKTESVTPDYFSANLSTQEIQYTSISQNSDEISKGEIYNYQKPEQGLPFPSDKEGNVQFGQKIQKPIGSFISNKENFETNQQTTSQLVEPTTTFKPFNQETTQKSFESRPQLSFHRACCGGSIFNKKPFSQNNLGSSNNSFDQNKGPISQKETPIEQSLDNKKLESQRDSQFVGIPEQFGGPRKPPTFDETGYHY